MLFILTATAAVREADRKNIIPSLLFGNSGQYSSIPQDTHVPGRFLEKSLCSPTPAVFFMEVKRVFCDVPNSVDFIMLKPTNSPQPKANPTQEKEVKSGIWATFSHSEYFFVGWDWFYIGNRLQET